MLTKLFGLGAAAVLLAACAGDPVMQHQQQVAQDPSAMLRIADAAQNSGDTDAAAAFYQRAAELQPDSAVANIGIARSLMEQGQVSEAIDTLRAAKRRNPSNAQLTATLGRLLVATNHPAEGLAAFDEGLQQDPQSVSLLIGRGVALDAIGQHQEAQDSYRKAIQYDPDNSAARQDLVLSQALGGKRREACRSPSIARISADCDAGSPPALPVPPGK
jgi:Flp pilus assembly protein TadD